MQKLPKIVSFLHLNAKTSENKYLIKIDTSIKWSDGNNLSVDDVIFTIENLSKIDSIKCINMKT